MSIGYYDYDESSEQISDDDDSIEDDNRILINVKVKDAFFKENNHYLITSNFQLGTFVIVDFAIK